MVSILYPNCSTLVVSELLHLIHEEIGGCSMIELVILDLLSDIILWIAKFLFHLIYFFLIDCHYWCVKRIYTGVEITLRIAIRVTRRACITFFLVFMISVHVFVHNIILFWITENLLVHANKSIIFLFDGLILLFFVLIFIIDTVVKLCIVIKHVLSIDFSALILED